MRFIEPKALINRGICLADNIFEQQRRAWLFMTRSAISGIFQFSFDGIGDTLEFALLRQNLNEICQAVIGHAASAPVFPSLSDPNQNV